MFSCVSFCIDFQQQLFAVSVKHEGGETEKVHEVTENYRGKKECTEFAVNARGLWKLHSTSPNVTAGSVIVLFLFGIVFFALISSAYTEGEHYSFCSGLYCEWADLCFSLSFLSTKIALIGDNRALNEIIIKLLLAIIKVLQSVLIILIIHCQIYCM